MAARIGDYKTITLEGYGSVIQPSSVMYNLKDNLGETDDLSKSERAKFYFIQSSYIDWQSQTIQPLWHEGETWMDIGALIHKQLI